MADYVKTITNGLNVFGLKYSTKWGDANGFPYTMVWGTSLWGYGFSKVIDVEKLISNQLNSTTNIYKQTDKFIENSFLVSNLVSREQTKTFTASLIVSGDLSSEEKLLGVWNYVFVSDTTNAENRDFQTWSTSSSVSVTYTSQAASTTTWT